MYKSRKRFDMCLKLPKLVYEEVKIILTSLKDTPQSKLYDTENLISNEYSNEISDF